MLSSLKKSPLHRKKDLELPRVSSTSHLASQTLASQNLASQNWSQNSNQMKTSGKENPFYTLFLTLLLAFLFMAVTGFPASLFSKTFFCRHLGPLMKHNRRCTILRSPELGWEHLERFGAGEIPADKMAKAVVQKQELDRDDLQARAKQMLERAAAIGAKYKEIPKGVVLTTTLREAIAKQLEPWLGGSHKLGGKHKLYTHEDLMEMHAQFSDSVRVVVDGKHVEVFHHKQQTDNPEWGTWYRGEQLQSMLQWLASRNLLPTHVEFVANLGDKPRVVKDNSTRDWPPMLSYCSSEETRDVIFVGYQYHRCFSLPWHSKDDCPSPPWNWTTVHSKHPWSSRQDQALWQGEVAGGYYDKDNWREKPRSQLVKLSNEYPDLLNATFLQCTESQCSPEANWFILNELGYVEVKVTPETQLNYKFLVDIDGESWSPEFFELLSTGAVVFKQNTTYREFSDIFFKPDVHYIQYATDLKDLPIKLMTALEMDDYMKQMGKLASDTARALVEQAAALEYVAVLLKSYAKLLQSPDEGGVKQLEGELKRSEV